MKSERYLLSLSKKIVEEAHKGQTRKITGEPYVEHPKRVAKRLEFLSAIYQKEYVSQLKCAALLHDVLEDTKETPESLKDKGVPETIIQLVEMLTRHEESYDVHIERLGDSIDAIRVKMADIQDNLQDLPDGSLKDKYLLARRYLSLRLERIT